MTLCVPTPKKLKLQKLTDEALGKHPLILNQLLILLTITWFYLVLSISIVLPKCSLIGIFFFRKLLKLKKDEYRTSDDATPAKKRKYKQPSNTIIKATEKAPKVDLINDYKCHFNICLNFTYRINFSRNIMRISAARCEIQFNKGKAFSN